MISLCRLSRGGSAAFGDAAAAAPPEQVAQVAQAMAANPGARGMDLAAKMMEKMGWKSGLGLGRNKQVGDPSLCFSYDSYVLVCCLGFVAHVPFMPEWLTHRLDWLLCMEGRCKTCAADMETHVCMCLSGCGACTSVAQCSTLQTHCMQLCLMQTCMWALHVSTPVRGR